MNRSRPPSLLSNFYEPCSAGAAEDTAYSDGWVDKAVSEFALLREHLDRMIDEVDKTGNNRVYIHFLGMLRDTYLARKKGKAFTFQSVILAGVYDIKNLKLKMINEGIYNPGVEEGKLYNSPWNKVDERFDRDWTAEGVRNAAHYLIRQEQNTLFDDMFKNLEAYPGLYQMIYDFLAVGGGGSEKIYSPDDPVVNWTLMFGYIKMRGEKVSIANRIFETRIINPFLSKDRRRRGNKKVNGVFKRDDVML